MIFLALGFLLFAIALIVLNSLISIYVANHNTWTVDILTGLAVMEM